jgi:hypothetical protein
VALAVLMPIVASMGDRRKPNADSGYPRFGFKIAQAMPMRISC